MNQQLKRGSILLCSGYRKSIDVILNTYINKHWRF